MPADARPASHADKQIDISTSCARQLRSVRKAVTSALSSRMTAAGGSWTPIELNRSRCRSGAGPWVPVILDGNAGRETVSSRLQNHCAWPATLADTVR